MKKTCLTLAIATTIGLSANAPHIVPAANLTADLMAQVRQGVMDDLAVFLPAGSEIPVRLCVFGGFAEIKGTPYTVVTKEDLYIRLTAQELLFSRDGENWLKPDELITGQLGVVVDVDEQGLFAALVADVHLRGIQ